MSAPEQSCRFRPYVGFFATAMLSAGLGWAPQVAAQPASPFWTFQDSSTPEFVRLGTAAWMMPATAAAMPAGPDALRLFDPHPLGSLEDPGASFRPAVKPAGAREAETAASQTSAPKAESDVAAPPSPPSTASVDKALQPQEETKGRLTGQGVAAWYNLSGTTASGEVYRPDGLTAGHRTLPFGTRVRVVNQQNGRSVIVRINDRGPVQRKFVIDLSRGSARELGISGTAPVALYVLDRPSTSGVPVAQSSARKRLSQR